MSKPLINVQALEKTLSNKAEFLIKGNPSWSRQQARDYISNRDYDCFSFLELLRIVEHINLGQSTQEIGVEMSDDALERLLDFTIHTKPKEV